MTKQSEGSTSEQRRRGAPRVFRQAASVLVLGAVAACAPVQTGEIDTSARPAPVERREPLVRENDARSAREALARVSERWRRQWYHTAVVRLEVTLFGLGAPAPGEWAQTIRVPGRARVDYLPLDSKSGVLYTPGMVYGFQEGERAATEERTDLAMIALADLPGMVPDSAMAALAAARVDTSLFRVANEDGAHVWIIGGGTNDSLRSEIAIDAERLLVRRATDVRPLATRTLTQEARVMSWREQEGLLLPEVVDRWREGTRTLRERWASVALDVALPVNLFDPAQWSKVQPPGPPR
jgi:hypothetical protein